MIPAAIIAEKAKKLGNGAKAAAATPAGRKVLTATGFAVAGAAAFLIVRSIVRKAKKNNAEKRIDNTEVQAAVRIRSACNPSGSNWLIDMDGTSFAVIKDALNSVSSFNKLAQEYKNLYPESLLDRLRAELDQGELAEVMKIINTKTL